MDDEQSADDFTPDRPETHRSAPQTGAQSRSSSASSPRPGGRTAR